MRALSLRGDGLQTLFRTCFDFDNSVGAASAKTDASIQDNSGLSQGPALDPVVG
jgi:hypothetical protein